MSQPTGFRRWVRAISTPGTSIVNASDRPPNHQVVRAVLPLSTWSAIAAAARTGTTTANAALTGRATGRLPGCGQR